MSKKIMVELTGKEAGLLKALANSEARLKKTAANAGVSVKELEGVVGRVENAGKQAMRAAADGTNYFVKGLKKAGKEGQYMLTALEQHFQEHGKAGRMSIDQITAGYGELDQEATEVLRRARAEYQKNQDQIEQDESIRKQEERVRGLLGELKKIPGQFSGWGDAIEQEMNTPLIEAAQRARQIANELMDIDPKRAQQFSDAIDRATREAENADLTRLISQLSQGNEEAKGLARSMGETLRSQLLESEGGVAGLQNRIERLSPAMRAAARDWRISWNTAADKAHDAFGDALNVLRHSGPESERAANQIVAEFQNAGRLSQAAMEKIFAPLREEGNIGLAMNHIRNELRTTGQDGNEMFRQMSRNAVLQLSQVAAGYIGVQEAIQLATQALQKSRQVIEEAQQGHITAGQAQASSYKNLTTLDREDRIYLLDDFVKEIAAEYNYAGQGIPSLIKAVGDARSSGGSFEQIQEAVRTAAELNSLDQENVDETATALIQAMLATKISDPKLLASQMMVGQETSQVTSANKFFRNAPATMISASRSAATGMERQSAIESLAVFSALSRAGGDVMGESSQTATIQLNAKVAEFFETLGKDFEIAKKKLREVDNDPMLSDKQKAREKMILQKQMEESSKNGQMIKDPGSFMGRLKFIRDNNMFEQLLDTVGVFGEQRFREGMKELMTAGETARDADYALRKLLASSSDVSMFNETVEDIREGATQQMRTASAQMETESASAIGEMSDTYSAILATNRKATLEAVQKSRLTFFSYIDDWMNQYTEEGLLGRSILTGNLDNENIAEGAVRSVSMLANRGDKVYGQAIADGHISTREQHALDANDNAISTVMRSLENPNAAKLLSDQDVVDALSRAKSHVEGERRRAVDALSSGGTAIESGEQARIDLYQKMVDLLQGIADEQRANRLATEAMTRATEQTEANTRPRNGRPDPSNAQNQANRNRGR